MKRCPQCNRVEADDTLAFCRTDGIALINDSRPLGGDTDTAKFSSSPNQLMLQVFGVANAKLGNRNEANSVISRFQEIRKTHYVMSFFVATIHARLAKRIRHSSS